MKIKQLLAMPVGEKVGGGFTLSIKTYKKIWQVDKFYWQQIICMDETGEMPVDVKTGTTYNPLRGRTDSIHVIVSAVQDAEYLGKDRKKLVVDQFDIPTAIAEPPQEGDFYGDYRSVVRSKIKCLLTSAKAGQQGSTIEGVLEFANDGRLETIVDLIMEK